MNPAVERAQSILIEHAVQVSDLLGLSDAMARIAVLLYVSPEGLSIPMICERLDLTKGTVSLYLRMLEQRRIVIRDRSKRQGKQKFFEINPRLWAEVLDDLRAKVERRTVLTEQAVAESLRVLESSERTLRGEDRLVAKLLSERLEKIREINRISRAMLDRFNLGPAPSEPEAPPLQPVRLSKH